MEKLKLLIAIVFISGCSPLKFEMVKDKNEWGGQGYLVSIPDVLIKIDANLVNGICNRVIGTISVPSGIYQAMTFPPIIGTANVDVEVKDGWLFTGAKVDTNTSDVIKGIVEVVVGSPTVPGMDVPPPSDMLAEDGTKTLVAPECSSRLFRMELNNEGQVVGLHEITI